MAVQIFWKFILLLSLPTKEEGYSAHIAQICKPLNPKLNKSFVKECNLADDIEK